MKIVCKTLTAFVILCTISCTSTNFRKDLDEKMEANQISEALEIVNDNKKKYIKEKNLISFHLDSGILKHLNGDYSDSIKELQEAEFLIDEAFTRSISDNFRAAITQNSYRRQYEGEDYENFYINVFNALNYFHQNDIESALVEVRKTNEKLLYLTGEYEAQGNRIREKITGFLQIPSELNYSNSALARYLGILFYREIDQEDSARIEAHELANAFKDYPSVYNFSVPKAVSLRDDVCDETDIPSGMARLNILSFTGLSPVKEVTGNWGEYMDIIETFDTSEQMEKFVSLEPPYVITASRGNEIDRIVIEIDNGSSFSLDLLEDISMVIKTLSERKEKRINEIKFNTAFFALPVYGMGLGLKVVYQSFFVYPFHWIQWASINYRTWSDDKLYDYVERNLQKEYDKSGLDVRMGRFFPARAYSGGINLPPGNYSITVTYYKGAAVMHKERHENEQIKENRLNLLQSNYLK